MSDERDSSPHSTWDEREYLERHFNEAACERLARANREYQQSHAEYIIPLAKLLNATRSEKQRLEEQLQAVEKERDDWKTTRCTCNEARERAEAAEDALTALRADAESGDFWREEYRRLQEQLEAVQAAVDDAVLVFVDTMWFDSYHHLASSSVATGDGRGIALPPIESAPAELPRISPPFGMAASSKREEAGADDSNPATSPDPTEGLPPDLVRILRDPTITIDRDHEIRLADGRTLFEHLHEWQNAPSNTASASLPASDPDAQKGGTDA